MSVSLLVCYFPTEIRHIWGYLHFWMIYLSETFLRHPWDIGSLVFTLRGLAYILTFEFLWLVLTLKPLNLLFVCQSVSQSLISLPIGNLWGSTSETSGLVENVIVKMLLFKRNLFNFKTHLKPKPGFQHMAKCLSSSLAFQK